MVRFTLSGRLCDTMVDMYDIKEFTCIAIVIISAFVIIGAIYLGITWIEIQIARWMGVDPIWIVGH